MPVRCQDCNSHFLLDASTVAQGIGCPDCGGTKLERDQPSPTHSDGEVRNMVDPATQLDQGGNPLQEGIWASIDGGWQPRYKRDESFAKVAARIPPPSGLEPQHHGTAQPQVPGGLHHRNLELLAWLDASVNGKPVREHWPEIYDSHGNPNGEGYGKPVTISVHHPQHLQAAIEAAESPQVIFNKGSMERHTPSFAALGSAIKRGQVPAPPGIGPPQPQQPQPQTAMSRSLPQDPYLPWYHQANVNRYDGDERLPIILTDAEYRERIGYTKEAIAPLLALGGRLLLGQAIGGLMRKAIGGQGNYTQGAPEEPYGNRPVSLVASEHTAVGVGAPVETPHSTPDLIEDHDPEAVDQQEFNDQDMSPAFQNPNQDVGVGGLSQSTGEDDTNQKLEFRHDSDAVGHAEMLLPLIMEYVNSDESALKNPQLKALHDELEREIPSYLDLADENDESVHKLLEELRKPEHVHAMRQGALPGAQPMGSPQVSGGGAMPGTYQNPVQPGGMPVSGRCMNCGGVVNADGSCPQCGAAAGANQMGNMQAPGQQQTPLGIMPSPYAHTAADHQGPITPQQKEVFAEYLIQQGRENEVAAMMNDPAMYADEWAQFVHKSTQPPEVDPAEQQPMPQVPPEQMGQMPVPGMSVPQPTAKTAADNPRRCPKCNSATVSLMTEDGDLRCHRCGNVWNKGVLKDSPTSKRSWVVKSYPDALNDSPNPVAAPAADATAPADPEGQQDSSLSWQAMDGTPLQVGATYELHNPNYPIPDIVKVEQVKPDSVVVTMEGEYNSPSDPQDANGPGYTHEIPLQEAQQQGLTWVPQGGEGDEEQSQDQANQDGIGQTVNTEPVEQPHDSFPVHTHVEKQATDKCPECDYGHVTSSYLSPELVQYECFRCSHQWKIADEDLGSDMNPESREWLKGDGVQDEGPLFDERTLAMASTGKSRDIRDIARRDPRNAEIHERLNKNAGAKFSPRQQKEFIDEDGVARNADRLNLDGTHYIESAFDNSKARADRVDDNYLGLGL